MLAILPGLDGSGRLSAPFISALESHGIGARVLAYPSRSPMGYEALRACMQPQLAGLLPFVLLGESFGSPLSIMLASNALPRLRGLILSTPFAQAPVRMSSVLAAALRLPLPLPPRALLSRLLFGRWRTPALEALLADALAGTPPPVLRARVSATLAVDVQALLPCIPVPTLCLQARQDRLLSARVKDALESGGPASMESQSFDGPHLLLQARATATASSVAAWMKRLPA